MDRSEYYIQRRLYRALRNRSMKETRPVEHVLWLKLQELAVTFDNLRADVSNDVLTWTPGSRAIWRRWKWSIRTYNLDEALPLVEEEPIWGTPGVLKSPGIENTLREAGML